MAGASAPLLGLAVLVAGLLAAALAAHRLAGWRVGRPAPVDWLGGLAALPRRYLHEVHAVVARDPFTARMHALAAGGLLAATLLALLGAIPVLGGLKLWWALVFLAFVVMLAGSLMVARRRLPQAPRRLSRGRFSLLPFLLLAYAMGGLIVSGDAALGEVLPKPVCLVALAFSAAGLLGLAVQIASGPMRHALAGALHLVVHPRPARFAGVRDTGLRPLDLAAPKLGAELPADFAWNRLAGFDACVQCGRCETACPAFAAGQPLNPKRLIQDLAAAASTGSNAGYAGSPYPGAPAVAGLGGPLKPVIGAGAMIHPDTLWSCTTCRACVEECPMMIEHVDAVIDLRRYQTLEEGAVPEKAAAALSELRLADDAGGRPPAARADFAAGQPLPVLPFEGGETDILLWLGEGAYDLRYGRTLRALLALLTRAGVDFAILGEAEKDCGDLARRLGDEATFQRLARENIATLARHRFRRIVTADPHAFHVLKQEYPAFGGSFEVLHHSQLLDGLVAEERLIPVAIALPGGKPVAYHDPCYLGRYNGEVEAPRRLLDRIGLSRVEMERHGLRSMCCGGGGGAPVSDIPGKARIADIRMAQAVAAGAGTVAVGCPQCTAMLEGVTGERPEVLDIAELLLRAVEAAGNGREQAA